MRRLSAVSLVLLAVTLEGCWLCRLCPRPPAPPPPVPLSGQVFFWISTDGDTYISCGRTAACEEGDLNFGRHSPLAVAAWDLGRKTSFVHFTLPQFPPGTEIMEAYLELNHNARNEDGRTDDLMLPVGRPAEPWDPMTRTWRSSADRGTNPAGYNVCLKSQAWSPTRNIASEVIGKSVYEATVFWTWPSAQPPIEKGFASANDFSRTNASLGIAPRLLVRAQLPPNTTMLSNSVRTYQPGEDLGRLDQPVLMMMAESGTAWPASWNAAGPTANCQ